MRRCQFNGLVGRPIVTMGLLGFFVLGGCNGSNNGPATETMVEGNMEAELPPRYTRITLPEDGAAWITLNNWVYGGGKQDPDQTNRPLRTHQDGLLIQLGSYTNPGEPVYVSYVAVKVNSVTYLNTPTGPMHWINIVSHLPDGLPNPKHAGPMSEDRIYDLYPNDKQPKSTANPNGFPCYAPADCACACVRRIHPLLGPKAIITYWQGRGGYNIRSTSLHAAAPEGHFATDVVYHFDLYSPVKIDVYEITEDHTQDPALLHSYPFGVHNIEVLVSHATEHGDNLDPAYP